MHPGGSPSMKMSPAGSGERQMPIQPPSLRGSRLWPDNRSEIGLSPLDVTGNVLMLLVREGRHPDPPPAG